MRFQDALQSRASALTEVDRRIGNYLLNSSLGITGLTAAHVAAEAGVHESTVVRFAQKLGYDGYPELRAGLAADQGRASPGERLDIDRDPTLAAVVASQIELLADLPRLVPQSSIDAAVDLLIEANRVLVIGRGLMMPAATFMTRKLRMVGVAADHSDQGVADAVERAALLRPGDVVLAFAFHDEYTSYSSLFSSLAQVGVDGILISDQEALFESDLPKIVLPVPRRQTHHGIVGAIIAIAYAIEYAIVARRSVESTMTSERLAELARSTETSRFDDRLGQSRDPKDEVVLRRTTPETKSSGM